MSEFENVGSVSNENPLYREQEEEKTQRGELCAAMRAEGAPGGNGTSPPQAWMVTGSFCPCHESSDGLSSGSTCLLSASTLSGTVSHPEGPRGDHLLLSRGDDLSAGSEHRE